MDGEVEEVDDEYGEKMTEFIAVADASFDWKGSLPDVPPKE